MIAIYLKHLRRVRSKGRNYFYHRKTGERLPDDEGDRIRRVLEINQGLDKPSRRIGVGSVAAIVNQYLASPEYARLAEETKRTYRPRLNIIADLWGDVPIDDICRKHVFAFRDRFADNPTSADHFVVLIRNLLRFAVARGYREDNPAEGVPKITSARDVRSHRSWPDEAIEKFLAVHEGTMMGLALKLGLYTGQRGSDVLRMRWADIHEGRIEVRQSKTGTLLEIRLHSALRETLDKQEPVSPIILTTTTRRPFTTSNFRWHFGKAVKAAGLGGQRLTFHGLRYAAAGQLAELGVSIKGIAAITGHKSLALLQRYTSGADQKRLGDAAILRWDERAQNGKLENRDSETGKPKGKGLKTNGK